MTDVLPAEGVSEAALLELASALERMSEHPLARAVLAWAEEQGVAAREVSDFQALPGNGLTGRWQGETLAGGSLKFIRTQAAVPQAVQAQAETLAEAGKTPLFFSRKAGNSWASLLWRTPSRQTAPRLSGRWQNMGIRVVMLTGDNERTARAIGRQAGVDEVVAGVLPDGKEQVIRRLKEQGKVAMVGDGINDAPALTRPISASPSAPARMWPIDAADVVLMKSRLTDVAGGHPHEPGHAAEHPRKPLLGVLLQHHRHPAGSRRVHPPGADPQPLVRRGGHEPQQLLRGVQRFAAELFQAARRQQRP